MTTPSASKAGYAFSTVWQLTPRLDARLRADGSRSPSCWRVPSDLFQYLISDLAVERPGVLVDYGDEHTEVYALYRAGIT
jgi:hypothetical protein